MRKRIYSRLNYHNLSPTISLEWSNRLLFKAAYTRQFYFLPVTTELFKRTFCFIKGVGFFLLPTPI